MMPEISVLTAYALIASLAYLVGSIPTGVAVGRLYRNVDVTQAGSGRSGATNVARTLGPGAGAIVLAADFAKGAAAVWLASGIAPTPGALGLAWLLAVQGHMHSPFIGWRGGRGVGTGLGGLAMLFPPLFALCFLSGSVVAATSRYVSLGSIVGTGLAILGGIIGYIAGVVPIEQVPFFVLTPISVIWAHGDNIERLRSGQERRLGERRQQAG